MLPYALPRRGHGPRLRGGVRGALVVDRADRDREHHLPQPLHPAHALRDPQRLVGPEADRPGDRGGRRRPRRQAGLQLPAGHLPAPARDRARRVRVRLHQHDDRHHGRDLPREPALAAPLHRPVQRHRRRPPGGRRRPVGHHDRQHLRGAARRLASCRARGSTSSGADAAPLEHDEPTPPHRTPERRPRACHQALRGDRRRRRRHHHRRGRPAHHAARTVGLRQDHHLAHDRRLLRPRRGQIRIGPRWSTASRRTPARPAPCSSPTRSSRT
jgi:hypothetical protein